MKLARALGKNLYCERKDGEMQLRRGLRVNLAKKFIIWRIIIKRPGRAFLPLGGLKRAIRRKLGGKGLEGFWQFFKAK